MALSATAPNMTRYYLRLDSPPTTPWSPNSRMPTLEAQWRYAMTGFRQSWILGPPPDTSLDTINDRYNLAGLVVSETVGVLEPTQPTYDPTPVLLSNPFWDHRRQESIIDSPVLFDSLDHTTAWQMVVDNDGVFTTKSVPLEWARYHYIGMVNLYTGVEDVFTIIDQSGNFATEMFGDGRNLTPIVLKRGGVTYIPDTRFPAPPAARRATIG